MTLGTNTVNQERASTTPLPATGCLQEDAGVMREELGLLAAPRRAGTGSEGLAAPTTSCFNDPRAAGAEGCRRTSPGPAWGLCDGSGEITAVFVGEQDGKPKPNGKGQC